MSKKRVAAKKSKSGAKSKRPARRSARTLMSVATSAKRTVEDRLAALAEVPIVFHEDEAHVQGVLGVLGDQEEPVEVQFAALETLQAAAFGDASYATWRGDYITTLRKIVAEADADAELRQRALGVLAREKDGFAQARLLEGLQSPEKAVVPPEKALQLLSYDVHAEAYSVARDIVSKPPNTAAKREALRLLAADASSAPLFERLLRDKGEETEIRQVSAAALHAVRPKRLQNLAREILLDESESEELRNTSLTALTHFGGEAVAADEELLQRVTTLRGQGSAKLKQGARRFIGKYSR